MPMFFFGQSGNFGKKTGCIAGNCENGYGVYVWKSGAKYEGYFRNKNKYGMGTYTSQSGKIYKGKWINNEYQKPKTSNTSNWQPPVKAVCNRKSKLAIAD